MMSARAVREGGVDGKVSCRLELPGIRVLKCAVDHWLLLPTQNIRPTLGGGGKRVGTRVSSAVKFHSVNLNVWLLHALDGGSQCGREPEGS